METTLAEHTLQLAQGNVSLAASAEVCASLLQDRTPSPSRRISQSQSECTTMEERDDPKIAVFLFRSEHAKASYDLLENLYP